MRKDVKLIGIECVNEKINTFVSSLLKQFWSAGDEFHNRSIHDAVKNQSYTNVIIYGGHLSIKTGKKLNMIDGDHEHNRKQAADVMSLFRGCEISKEEDADVYAEIVSLIGESSDKYLYLSVYVPDLVTELPALTPITFEDIVKAPIKDKSAHKSEMLKYFEQRRGIDAPYDIHEYFNAGIGAISRVEIENFYTDVSHSWKYGEQYHRIFWDGELIGIIHRYGKYLDTYSYSTFDKEKWDDMAAAIESELSWGFEEPVDIISYDSDLFGTVKIHGRDFEEHTKD